MAVNVTANWRLIRSFDALLRRSAAGRALFMTSGITRSCRPYWGVYTVSKAALEALARTYAGEVRQTAVRVNLMNPGALRTAMRAQAMPGEDPMSLKPPEALAPDIVRMLSPDCDDNGVLFDFPSGKTVAFGAAAFLIHGNPAVTPNCHKSGVADQAVRVGVRWTQRGRIGWRGSPPRWRR